jgi:O-antigen/teichoic acid export membrane protein
MSTLRLRRKASVYVKFILNENESKINAKKFQSVQIIANLTSAAIKLSLIYIFHAPIIWFVYAFLFDVILLSTGYSITYQRKQRSFAKWEFNRQLGRKLFSYSWPLIISGIMVSVYMRIDQIMLQNMKGTAAAGAYATVVRFSEAWNFIPTVIITTLFPAILNARRDDIKRYKKRIQNLYDLMVYLSLPAAIIITFTSHLIYKALYSRIMLMQRRYYQFIYGRACLCF